MNKKAYPLALLSLLTALPSEAQSVADTLSYTATITYRPDTLSNARLSRIRWYSMRSDEAK